MSLVSHKWGTPTGPVRIEAGKSDGGAQVN